MPKPARYMLTTDGDCHWYCLPVRLKPAFDKALSEGEADEFCTFCNLFDQYRVGGSPTLVTFEKPKIGDE